MPNVYRALGDSTRRHNLIMLKQGSKTQKEIVEAFDISQPAIKKHLIFYWRRKSFQRT